MQYSSSKPVVDTRTSSSLAQHAKRRFCSRIAVWPSGRCAGHLQLLNPSSASEVDAASLQLIDATVDLRPHSLQDFRIRHYTFVGDRAFRRVSLQVAASATPEHGNTLVLAQPARRAVLHESESSPYPSGFLSSDGEQLLDWEVLIDYVTSFSSSSLSGPTQWQVVLSVVAPARIKTDETMSAAFNSEAGRNISLHLTLPAQYTDGRIVALTSELVGFDCFAGLTKGVSIPRARMPGLPRFSPSCAGSEGSVLVVGKLPRINHVLANFVARALLGPIQFDTVAVPVKEAHPASTVQTLCGRFNNSCSSAKAAQNDAYMNEVAAALERMLAPLGISAAQMSRILLFPVCRLSDDGQGGCPWSGESNHAYTLLAPWHKWFAILDVDEFIADEVSFVDRALSNKQSLQLQASPRNASAVFTERSTDEDAAAQIPGALHVGTMAYYIQSDAALLATAGDDYSAITRDLINLGGVALAADNRTICQSSRLAKSVLSCRAGVGLSDNRRDGFAILRNGQNLKSPARGSPERDNLDKRLLIYQLAQQTQSMRGCHYANAKTTVKETPKDDIRTQTHNHSATQVLRNKAAPSSSSS